MTIACARVTTCPLNLPLGSDKLKQAKYGDSFVAHRVVKGYDLRLSA